MEQIDLSGMGVALVTPFTSNGDIDFDALSNLIDRHLSAGTDYLVVLGTTAETPTLSAEEQFEITQTVINQVNKKIPIILGLGGNNTRALVKRLEVDDFTGIDALLSVTPYYNKPSQEGLFQHYKALSEASSLPIVLYNVPARTGVNMCANTTLRLARECNKIIAVKEASGMSSQIDTIVRFKPQRFQVISGDDSITLSLISIGVEGVISVVGNAFPKQFGQMVHLALEDNYGAALAIHQQFGELFGLLSVDGNPSGIKFLMSQMCLLKNVLRLPLVPVKEITEEKIKTFLGDFQSKF
ncbi:MAG: 4-hydroxy-tetrahydrodipicolinate synthase [Dysgonamonadaceae bacterium]|jgi:4-hydroxy-tetrahydrodipicolinate synthase|nr:4-hydroxy-tetrahydrodipicolinate synthase [Dysgonamonadaceae bacterium]